MWRPPERIRHEARSGHWPSAAEAAASRLFSEVQVGTVKLAQRTWVPAMVPRRASEEGLVTPDVLDWYECFARGRPGAIVVEATGIRDVPSGPLLRIGHDRFLPGLRDLARVVRDASNGETRLFIQLIDFLSIRRRPHPSRFFAQFLAITPRHRAAYGRVDASDAEVRGWLSSLPADQAALVLDARELESLEFGSRERVTDMHLDHVRHLPAQLPALFADAARRARDAGFDGVELHFAHAYTMASFLSRSNVRDDGYGGDIANRARLPLEVFSRVRAEVGHDFVAGCRFLADECISGGSDAHDAAFFGCEFARAGMDYLSLSRGGKFDDAKQPRVGEAAYPYTGPSGLACMPTVYVPGGPFGRNLPHARAVRERVRAAGCNTPIVACGGINSFELAESALQTGTCDLVGAARQSLADPDWWLKM